MKKSNQANKQKASFILGALLMLTTVMYGQLHPGGPTYYKTPSVSYTYSDVSTPATQSKSLYVRNSDPFLSQSCPAGSGPAGQELLKKATLKGILDLGDDYRFGKSDYSYVLNISISGFTSFSGTNGLNFSNSRQMTINCNAAGQNCNPEQQFSIDFTSQYSQINRFVVTATLVSSSGLASTHSAFRLRTFFSEEYVYKYTGITAPVLSLIPIASPASQNPVTFSWGNNCSNNSSGAPNFEFQLLRLYNTDPQNITDERNVTALVDWSKALSIETGSSQTQLKLTVAEGKGYYVWRIRPIGNYYDGGIANDRNWGPWSDQTIFTQGATVNLTSGSVRSNLFFYNGIDEDKNWIYGRSFIEGDVRDNSPVVINENISYANGLQMVKQNQEKLAVEDKVLADQTIADFSGRNSLATLASPINQNKLEYKTSYITNAAGDLYTAKDYDADNNYRNQTPTVIGNSSDLVKYYSDQNSDASIPSAGGYPFSRTLYYRDGTNRPKEQSSPGIQHKLEATGAKHTVRNSNASVSDIELVRVFGDEAPAANSVSKSVTTDANNTTTVTYTSKEGQTIATCLSKPGSDLLDPLTSQSGAGFDVVDVIKDNLPYGEFGLSSLKNVTFTSPTLVTLNYDITPAVYQDNCVNICKSCDYKVTFFIHNLEDQSLTWSHSMVINPATCGMQSQQTYTTTVTLEPGDYTIERRVEANTVDAATGKTYLDEMQSAVKDELEAQYSTGTGLNLDNHQPVHMDDVYAYLNANDVDGLNNYLGASETDVVKLVRIAGCDTLRIPIEHCKKYSCSPVKFEEYIIDRWKDIYGTSITTYLPQYSTGQFNAMIGNMVSSGLYTCDQLWTCWDGMVQNYKSSIDLFNSANTADNTSGVHPSFDLLSEFLKCTGYHLQGFTTTAFGNPGYLSHPYAYFNYALGNNAACEQVYCSGPCMGAQLSGFDATKWLEFYSCVKNSVPATGDEATLEKIVPKTHLLIDSCKSVCQARYQSFVTSLEDVYHANHYKVETVEYPGPESEIVNTVSISEIYCQAQNLVNQCASQCNLTVVPNADGIHVDQVGIDDEPTKFAQALSYNYELALTDREGMCGADYIKVGYNTVNNDYVVEYLNNELNAARATAGTYGLNWDYLSRITAIAPSAVSQCLSENFQQPTVFVHPDIPSYFTLSTSPYMTKTDVSTGTGYKLERIVQNNILKNSDFNVTMKLTLLQPLSSSGTFRWQDYPNHSAISFVSGSMIIDAHGPLAAGTVLSTTYTLHIDNTTGHFTHGIGSQFQYLDEPVQLQGTFFTDLDVVTCPALWYFFNANQGAGILSPKPLVSAGEPALYSTSIHLPIGTVMSQDAANNTFSFLITPDFNILSASDATIKRLSTALATDPSLTGSTPVYVYNPLSLGQLLCYSFCASETCSAICLKWKPIEFPPIDPVEISCAKQSAGFIKNSLAEQTQRILAKHREKLLKDYKDKCLNSATLVDHFMVSYPLGYYHYTLYYYDRAGNLIKTVPPQGVAIVNDRNTHPEHTYVTEYEPNSLKQIVRQKTPDGGETRYIYDNKGRLRFSQNAKQLALNSNTYSYTKYDNLGRIIEVGQLAGLNTSQVNDQSYPSTGNEKQRTVTVYSTAANVSYFNGKAQRYLQNRVSYTYTDEDGLSSTANDRVTTYFSYDPHGNVEWLIQDQAEIGKSYIAYEYDVISGSVLKVKYNEALPDKFFHRYTYDKNKRIKTAETSKDDVIWDKDATYNYYAHGPLKNVTLGEDKVQNNDYIYTIEGWLKGMNHSSLDVDNDPSHDGKAGTAQAYTAKDIYGMMLSYYAGDFNRSGSPYNSVSTNPYHLASPTDLFNGNISSWTNNTGYTVSGNKYEQLTGNVYRYDELNRITNSNFSYFSANSWNATNEYHEDFSYDANGNIQSLVRNGYDKGGAEGVKMDDMTYFYENTANHYPANTNKLRWVSDIPSSYDDDLENEDNDNYTYDAIGNLTADPANGVDEITWNVYGKIASIKKTNGDLLRFLYNANGERVRKELVPASDPANISSTYYALDVAGTPMAIYKRSNTGVSPNYTATFKLSEQPIYGSDRIGERREDLTVAGMNYTNLHPGGIGPFQQSTMAGGLGGDDYSVQPVILSGDTLSPLIAPVARTVYKPYIIHLGPFNLITHRIIPSAGVVKLSTAASTTIGNSTILFNTDNLKQGKYAASVKDNCGNVILSASSVTLTNGLQVCYVYDAYNQLLLNSANINASNLSQMAFMKRPGNNTEYYLFTTGSDKKAYYHTIDLATHKVLTKNNLLDNTRGDYGQTMKVVEDLSGNASSQLYLRRYNSNLTADVVAFEISTTGIAGAKVIANFDSGDKDGVGAIELSPDASKLAVADNDGWIPNPITQSYSIGGEIKLYTLGANHTTATPLTNIALGGNTAARSLAFNQAGTVMYYGKNGAGVFSINKYVLSTAAKSTVITKDASGDIRRGNNGKFVSVKPNSGSFYSITDGTTPSYTISTLNNIGTFTGGLPVINYTIKSDYNSCNFVSSANNYTRNLLKKQYELKDHLGNVRVTITDMKNWSDRNSNGIPDGGEFTADLSSYTNYYAFGSPEPKRSYSPDSYRYGFNGKENDNEVKGEGNQQDYGMRIYDPRLGKFLSVDPLSPKFAYYTPYQFAGNRPIWAVDLDGLESGYITYWNVIVTDDGEMLAKQLTRPLLTTKNGDWSGIKNENGYFFKDKYYSDPHQIPKFNSSKKTYESLPIDANVVDLYKSFRKTDEGQKFEGSIKNYVGGFAVTFIGAAGALFEVGGGVEAALKTRFGKGAFDALGQAVVKGDVNKIDWSDVGATMLIENKEFRDLIKSVVDVNSKGEVDIKSVNESLAEYGLRLSLNKVQDAGKNGDGTKYVLDVLKKEELKTIKEEVKK